MSRTIASEIANLFEGHNDEGYHNFSLRWVRPDGRTLMDVIKMFGGTHSEVPFTPDDDVSKFEFRDSSCITITTQNWGVGFIMCDCYSRYGDKHFDTCHFGVNNQNAGKWARG